MLNTLVIINTLRCDLKCEHCLRGFPKERPDFPMELLDKLLTEAMPFGAKHIALTGGEPHLHPEFETMVDKISAYGYTWHFISHGQRTKPYVPLLEKYREKVTHVALSIDGANAQTHDDIRQRKGAFDRVVAAARNYVSMGFRLQISTSLNQKNMDELEGIIALAEELNATGLTLCGTTPTSWNKHLVLNDSETFNLNQEIIGLKEKTQVKIRVASSLYTGGGVNFCGILNFHELTFNPRGQLIFCCDTISEGAVIGSLLEHTFSNLIDMWLEKSFALQRARARKIGVGTMNTGFDTCTYCNHFLTE